MPRDFRQIGDLTKTVMPSPSTLASTAPLSKTSLTSFATTGSVDRVAKVSNVIGPQRGVSGSAGTSMITAQDLGRLMGADDPKATDKAVEALLRLSVKSCLRAETVGRFGPGGYEAGPTSYRLMDGVPETDREAALAVLRSATAPATAAEILQLLTRLKVMTVSPSQGSDDLKMQMACYAQELFLYPGDVVRHVLRSQPRHSKFWPTWSELVERLEIYSRKRSNMLTAFAQPGLGR